MGRTDTRLLVTCEHGGHRIPAAYAHLFRGGEAVLSSHRGWDPGALPLARSLASGCDAPLIAATVSRLLVELNRSPGHPQLFSEFTRSLSAAAGVRILERYYEPYRAAVRTRIDSWTSRGLRVIHVSVHTFTPVWKGVPRDIDVAWLYDPARGYERALVARWLRALAERAEGDVRMGRPGAQSLRLRRNAPYRGTSDGLTTWLRKRFSAEAYLGVELEVAQHWPLGPRAPWEWVRTALLGTLQSVLGRADMVASGPRLPIG